MYACHIGLITSKGFGGLISKAYHLNVLNVSGCAWFDATCGNDLSSHSHGLESLNISNVRGVNDNMLKVLSKGLSRLIGKLHSHFIDAHILIPHPLHRY